MPMQPEVTAGAVSRVVYRNDSEFNSHPFQGGLWRTGDGSLLLGFMSVDSNYRQGVDVSHDNIAFRRRRLRTIRSADNGMSWDESTLNTVFETPAPDGAIADDHRQSPLPEGDDADVLIASGAIPGTLLPESRAWVRVSTDGGRKWGPASLLPMYKLASLSGHGLCTRRPDGIWILGLTAASADGWARRPVLYGSTDGVTWAFLSFVTPAPGSSEVDAPPETSFRFAVHPSMYPRPIALRDGRLLVSVRSQRDPTSVLWTEIYESRDGGRTCRFLSRVNDWGAPGDLVEMQDGRIVCVYGYRLPPYGIRYRVSLDGGRTWGAERILRSDGGSWDLGYPRVIEVSEGRLLTVYYFNLASDAVQMNGGVRHIASTEFTP
jgi:hypothetical protein